MPLGLMTARYRSVDGWTQLPHDPLRVALSRAAPPALTTTAAAVLPAADGGPVPAFAIGGNGVVLLDRDRAAPFR
jgi:hypothetical protein